MFLKFSISHLIGILEFELPAIPRPGNDVLKSSLGQELQQELPELHRPCVTQEAMSLMMCAVLTVERGVRLMMVVTIMRCWMMGNMGSVVAVGVMMTRML